MVKDNNKIKRDSKGTTSVAILLAGAVSYVVQILPQILRERNIHALSDQTSKAIAHVTGIVPSSVQTIARDMSSLLSQQSVAAIYVPGLTNGPHAVALWQNGQHPGSQAVSLTDLVTICIRFLVSRLSNKGGLSISTTSTGVLALNQTIVANSLVPIASLQTSNLETREIVPKRLISILILVLAAILAGMIVVVQRKRNKDNNKNKKVTVSENTALEPPAGSIQEMHNLLADKNAVHTIMTAFMKERVADLQHRSKRTTQIQDSKVSENLSLDDVMKIAAEGDTSVIDTINEQDDLQCERFVQGIAAIHPNELLEAAMRLREMRYVSTTRLWKHVAWSVSIQRIVRIIDRGLRVVVKRSASNPAHIQHVRFSLSEFLFAITVNSGMQVLMDNMRDSVVRARIEDLASKRANPSPHLVAYIEKNKYIAFVTQVLSKMDETHNYWLANNNKNKNNNAPACKSMLTKRVAETINRSISLLHAGEHTRTLPSDVVRVFAYLAAVYSFDVGSKAHNGHKNNTNSGRVFTDKYQVDRCYIGVLAASLIYIMHNEILRFEQAQVQVLDDLDQHPSHIMKLLGRIARQWFKLHGNSNS